MKIIRCNRRWATYYSNFFTLSWTIVDDFGVNDTDKRLKYVDILDRKNPLKTGFHA